MQKKICLILCVVLTFLTLSACTSSAQAAKNYTLIQENGVYYVDMNLGPSPEDDNFVNPIGGRLYFDSLDEMVHSFQTGNFSEEAFAELERFPRENDGKIPVPNLSELAEPVVPASLGAYKIHVSGVSWSFYYNPDGAENAQFFISEKKYHDERVEEFLNYEMELANRDRLAITEVADRNATSYTWFTDSTSCKHILYMISTDETVYYVQEVYENMGSQEISFFYLWFEYQGEYVYVTIDQPSERPAIEWITAFSVKPYEGGFE